MAEQEDVEGQLRWRVEAEVRLATEAAQQAHAQQESALRREASQLRVRNLRRNDGRSLYSSLCTGVHMTLRL